MKRKVLDMQGNCNGFNLTLMRILIQGELLLKDLLILGNNQRNLRASHNPNPRTILLIGTSAHQAPSLNRQSLLLNLKSQNQMMASLIQL